MAFGAVVGSTAFFITHGFKQNAEQREKQLIGNSRGLSDISKILYLEVIDTTFSIDGVLGAFAFTLSVPLILIGNGPNEIGNRGVVGRILIHGIGAFDPTQYIELVIGQRIVNKHFFIKPAGRQRNGL